MNVTGILNKSLADVTAQMHQSRRTALSACVHSLLHGSSATVTQMGRGLKSNAKEKHNIKRAGRLLSNHRLHGEAMTIYTSMARTILGEITRPIILIDWSDLDASKRHFLLRATLAMNGRCLTLYEEVHEVTTKEKPKTHRQYLRRLATIVGPDCRPIIVTDAGFRTPWFREVLALNWDFVGRSRKPNYYSLDDEHWQSISVLYEQATATAKAFSGYINQSKSQSCTMVLYKQKRQGRADLTRQGQPRRSNKALKYKKSANDPWLLSTSLPRHSQLAKRVVKIYRTRMQIEEGFRDMKSSRFGLGFEQNDTRQTKRMTILILLTTLANWILMVLGMAATVSGRHRQYQANTTRHKNVLSLPFLGLRVVADRTIRLRVHQLRQAILELNTLAREACAGFC
jgi:hypothetical protein